MSGKSGKSGKKQRPSRQEQQATAARRRHVPQPMTAVRVRPPQPGPAGPAEAAAAYPSQRYYLDVSAVRIQDWLGRTPDLRLRRGASALLSQATGRTAWPDAALPTGTAWNAEAGDLDGVVSLVLAPEQPEPPEQHEADQILHNAAVHVASELRRAMPHCPVQAVTGEGGSYAEAYQEISRARADGVFLIDAPAAPAEAVLARPCDACRAAPAVEPKVPIAAGNTKDLCAECTARLEAAGRTASRRPEHTPRPERRMREALEHAAMTVSGFPDSFEELVQAGKTDTDMEPTQLALIYADGNQVGEFLSAAASHAARHGTPAKADIVRTLDDATLAALADAITACYPASDRPAVLAHVAGGDDLMVSVPARFAWPFVPALLSAFGDELDKATTGWPEPVRTRLPSMSAGLVFHHWKYPFSDAVRLAKAQLGAAKQATRGKGPSVAFLDLTADGEHPPRGRAPLTLEQLTAKDALVASIAAIPASHRQTLTAYLRSGESAKLAGRVVDLGHRPLWRAVAQDADGGTVKDALENQQGNRDELRRMLDLARWWPPEQAPHENGDPA